MRPSYGKVTDQERHEARDNAPQRFHGPDVRTLTADIRAADDHGEAVGDAAGWLRPTDPSLPKDIRDLRALVAGFLVRMIRDACPHLSRRDRPQERRLRAEAREWFGSDARDPFSVVWCVDVLVALGAFSREPARALQTLRAIAHEGSFTRHGVDQ